MAGQGRSLSWIALPPVCQPNFLYKPFSDRGASTTLHHGLGDRRSERTERGLGVVCASTISNVIQGYHKGKASCAGLLKEVAVVCNVAWKGAAEVQTDWMDSRVYMGRVRAWRKGHS